MHRFVVVAVILAVANAALVTRDDTTIQKYPHQASLLHNDTHRCGATILSARHILTTASCFYTRDKLDKIEEYKVSLGSSQATKGTLFNLKQLFVHNEFDTSYDHNVAVALLDKAIVFSDVAQAAVIAPEDQKAQDGDVVVVTGWGKVEELSSQEQNLQVDNIRVVDSQQCAKGLAIPPKWITKNMFCAGGGDTKKPSGDLGGPVIDQKKQLIGILSSYFEPEKGRNRPSVYLNVAAKPIRKFIVEKLQKN